MNHCVYLDKILYKKTKWSLNFEGIARKGEKRKCRFLGTEVAVSRNQTEVLDKFVLSPLYITPQYCYAVKTIINGRL